jgi:hypothetical protein
MRIGFLLALFALCLSSCSAKSNLKSAITGMKKSAQSVQASAPVESAGLQLPQSMKLLVGAGGIYAAFLYYGTLQEDVFRYKAADGTMFKAAWFLQFLGTNCSYVFFSSRYPNILFHPRSFLTSHFLLCLSYVHRGPRERHYRWRGHAARRPHLGPA